MATQQSDLAVSYANQIQSILQQLRAMRVSAQEIKTINTATPLGNWWNVLSTTALATDGSLGTADGSPNTAHPIDSRVYPALTRGQVSATQMASALGLVLNIVDLCAGTAIGANGAAPGTLDSLTM